MERFFCIIVSFILLITGLFAQTVIEGGDVNGLWRKAHSPFHINGEITIPNDSSLRIEPGVIIEFQGYYALQVQGQLLASGTENDTIVFTVNDTAGLSNLDTTSGAWHGIRFYDTPLTNDSSRLEYCKLQFGKAVSAYWSENSGGALCVLNFGKIMIANCLFTNNIAGGPETESPSGGAIHMAWSDVRITESTLTHNYALNGGAVQYHESNPVFINCTFSFNSARDGGAIVSGGKSTLKLIDCSFIENHAKNVGGGIRLWDNTRNHLENVTFTGNTAYHGGGVSASNCSLYIDHSNFINNSGTWGGGIHSWQSELHVNDCRFEQNTAADLSGGIHSDFTTLTIKNTIFKKNNAALSAGIHSWNSDVQLQHCIFEENSAEEGAGVNCAFSQIQIDASSFIMNSAKSGAGVRAHNSDLLLNDVLFKQNKANTDNGGGIFYTADSTIFGRPYQLSLKDNQFFENTAGRFCGGVWVEQINSDISMIDIEIDKCDFYKNHADRFGPLRIAGNISGIDVSDSRFTNNTSTQWVAGPGFVFGCSGRVNNCIFSSNYSTFTDTTALTSCVTVAFESNVDFLNCTFVDTSDVAGYGLSVRRGVKSTLTNCIIWGCGDKPISITTANDSGCDIYVNYCNIENGSDSIFVSDSLSTLHWGSGNLAVNPYFVDVENGDFHLSDSSLCIGAGINCYKLSDEWQCAPEFDMDGNVRPAPNGSNADIGAYENYLAGSTGVEYMMADIPNHFKLHQNYPNPFNPITTINYELPITNYVDLTIYNLLGQKIETLVLERQPAGKHKVEWQAHDFASGIYIYRLETGSGYNFNKKLVLLK